MKYLIGMKIVNKKKVKLLEIKNYFEYFFKKEKFYFNF